MSVFAQSQCDHKYCPDHCCNADGLWWMDEEYPDIAGVIWNQYVEKMHEFMDYRDRVANALGLIHDTVMNGDKQ